MIKLIMSDMDGTLLDENGCLPKGFADIARQLKEKGVIFAPCSGRQYSKVMKTNSCSWRKTGRWCVIMEKNFFPAPCGVRWG